MELATYLWTFDKRWMFSLNMKSPSIIWLVPMISNIILTILVLTVLIMAQSELDECFQSYPPQSWLIVQFVTMCLKQILICLMYYKILQMKKMVKDNEDYLLMKQNVDRQKFDFWIRSQILMSEIGIFMVITSIFEIIWAIFGWNKIGRVQTLKCEYPFVKFSMALNIGVPLASIIPFCSTLFFFIVIKATVLPFSCIFPNTFVRIKKFMNKNINKDNEAIDFSELQSDYQEQHNNESDK